MKFVNRWVGGVVLAMIVGCHTRYQPNFNSHDYFNQVKSQMDSACQAPVVLNDYSAREIHFDTSAICAVENIFGNTRACEYLEKQLRVLGYQIVTNCSDSVYLPQVDRLVDVVYMKCDEVSKEGDEYYGLPRIVATVREPCRDPDNRPTIRYFTATAKYKLSVYQALRWVNPGCAYWIGSDGDNSKDSSVAAVEAAIDNLMGNPMFRKALEANK